MLMLSHIGFFAQMHLYLSGQTTNDPHNPLWILSKTLCVWMFFHSSIFIKKKRKVNSIKRTSSILETKEIRSCSALGYSTILERVYVLARTYLRTISNVFICNSLYCYMALHATYRRNRI
jgi:hypothetical protein